ETVTARQTYPWRERSGRMPSLARTGHSRAILPPPLPEQCRARELVHHLRHPEFDATLPARSPEHGPARQVRLLWFLATVRPAAVHDVVSHYNRFDVFDLKINRKRLTPASFAEEGLPIPAVTLLHLGNSPSSCESDFDVWARPLAGRAEFLTLPLYDLLYL